jgi:hypothetical protein
VKDFDKFLEDIAKNNGKAGGEGDCQTYVDRMKKF